ncbi:hypothetical protein N0V90_002532 [Kalmusia sp. IMI 367209]|nr:hypothetical protein N0V90_002532 [Kalmusia sp. IMI 367209]
MFFNLLRLYNRYAMARRQARDGLPYKSHPLYNLRRGTLIAAIIGVFLNVVTIVILSDSYYHDYRIPYFLVSAFVLVASVAYVSYDLVTYAAREAVSSVAPSGADAESQTPVSDEPAWPSMDFVKMDLVFALVLQYTFWVGFADIASSRGDTLEAYAILAIVFASVLHAIAFWKELMARKKAAWQRELDLKPCENCGHVTVPTHIERSTVDISNNEESGPSRPSFLPDFGKRKIVLPKWAQRPKAGQYSDENDKDVNTENVGENTSEPLLVTPEESTTDAGGPSSKGYGTMAQSVESLSSIPETVVRKKDKGKKRLVEV